MSLVAISNSNQLVQSVQPSNNINAPISTAQVNAGIQIINDLSTRVRTLEKNLNQERIEKNNIHEQYEDRLFTERQQREQLQTQILTLNNQISEKNQRITHLETQLTENTRLVQLSREEVAALTLQVDAERVQVRLLTEQHTAAMARSEQLHAQVVQLVTTVQQQNAVVQQQNDLIRRHQFEQQQSTWPIFWEGGKVWAGEFLSNIKTMITMKAPK